MSGSGEGARPALAGTISGEFHFWRHPRVFWPRILDAISELGIDTVATFFCWQFHETAEGQYDLGGETAPERDVDAFMAMCAERGLRVFARPGPIIDSEWPSRGPSEQAATLERTDPEFRRRAEPWIAAISAKLAEHQAPHGPVSFVQIDNEAFYPHFTEASATEADAAIHIPFDAARVLADLEAWRADSDHLPAELRPFAAAFPAEPAPAFAELSAPQRVVAFDFLNSVLDEYLGWVHGRMREAGIEVPITTNVKQSCAYLDCRRFERTIEHVGFNYYLEHLRSAEQLRVGQWWGSLARTDLGHPWAPEFWCGRWLEEDAVTDVFKEDHYRYVILATLALGFRALNFFMLVDRDDWHYAALTGLGRPHAAARAIESVRPVLAASGADERLGAVGIVWSRPHHQDFVADRFHDWRDPSAIWTEQEEAKEHPAWWESFGRLADADHDVFLVGGEEELLAAPCLLYAGPAWAEDWIVRGLEARLERGLPTIVSGELPTQRLDLSERQGAAAALAAAARTEPAAVLEAVAAAGAEPWVSSGGALTTTAYRRPDGTTWLFLVNREERPVVCALALREELRGRGRRVLAGPDPFAGGDPARASLPSRTVTLLELAPA